MWWAPNIGFSASRESLWAPRAPSGRRRPRRGYSASMAFCTPVP